MNGTYTSIERIFSKVARDLSFPVENINQADIIEWTAEALEAIGSRTAYQPAVALVEVKNHQCEIPDFFHAVIQIARNNKWSSGEGVTVADVLEEQQVDQVDYPVAIGIDGMPVHDYEFAYYRPYFDIMGEYYISGNFNIKKYTFTVVRLANQSFFDTIVCKQPEYERLYASCQDEYTIVGNMFRFSFQTGQVAISYLRQVVDTKTGFPMVPDTFSNITAITKYITMKLMEREFYNNRQGSDSRLAKAESDWQWYCRQAKNEDLLPQTIDEYDNIMQQRNYLVPQTTRYYGFFGRLAHRENRSMIQ